MGDLLSTILFAGLFLVMMRYGCGRHSHSAPRHDRNTSAKHIDPVCGNMVAETEGYGVMYRKKLYRFCSKDCMSEFEEDPELYISRLTGSGSES